MLWTRNLIRWMRQNFTNSQDINCCQIFIELSYYQQLTQCVPQFAGGPLGSWGPGHEPTQPIGKSGPGGTYETCLSTLLTLDIKCIPEMDPHKKLVENFANDTARFHLLSLWANVNADLDKIALGNWTTSVQVCRGKGKLRNRVFKVLLV